MTIPQFQRKILSWYKHNRRDLPWRRTKDPYKILVSEVMLQQTQVSRVLPKYKEFLKEFPTLSILARARIKRLLKAWQGLGYWRRALFLRETAQKILKDFKGKFQKDLETLEMLPGIGPYTARALSCFAFGSREAFLDTNIRRVYLHFFFRKKERITDKEILPIAQKALSSISSHGNRLRYPKITPREWHYALFDYGATMLKDKAINRRSKHYTKQSKFEGSFRSFRTKAVRLLLAQPGSKVSKRELENFLKNELTKYKPLHQTQDIISSLLKDLLIKQSKHYYTIS